MNNAVVHRDAFENGSHMYHVTALPQLVVCYVVQDHNEKDQTRQA